MIPWYEQYPNILAREKAAYEEKCLAFTLNETLLLTKNIVVFEGDVKVVDGKHSFRVVYSPLYPLVGVHVLDMSAIYPRHQNPRERNLCLPAWVEGEMGADKVLQAVRLINLLSQGEEALAGQEVRGPEPVSAWFKYTDGCNALIPEPFTCADIGDSGSFKIIVNSYTPPYTSMQGTLIEISNSKQGMKMELDLGLLGRTGRLLEGDWFRYTKIPPFDLCTYDQWIDWFSRINKKFLYQFNKKQKSINKQNNVEVFAIIHPEEGPGYREYRDQWQILLRSHQGQTQRDFIMRPNILPMGDSYFRRAPFLKGLANKRVVMTGLGAIGSIIAVELARAGVGDFVLVDHNILRPGNVVRHASDLRAFGLPKVLAIQTQIQYINPECNIEPIIDRLGAPPLVPEEDHTNGMERLSMLIKESDILISTIANLPVEYCINDIAVSMNVPAIYASVFYGTWGGQVFRNRPGGACLRCYQHSSSYGNVLMPSEQPDMYFDGCNDPSFPGTGFDSSVIANLASRFAIQTLLRGDGYPDAAYNLITWCSRGEVVGNFPDIKFELIDKRPVCSSCNPKKTN